MSLRWRIVAILLTVSLFPLALVGIGSWVVLGMLLEEKSLDLHRSVVESHARSIELYLEERVRALDLAARSQRFDTLRDQANIEQLLNTLNDTYGMSFIDLGVIADGGEHLAYAGPYDLLDKNYAGEEWFRYVTQQGTYISDVFLGFRRVPHCVIAVKRQEGRRYWILRATINSVEFNTLVQAGQLGESGDAFLVNSEGFYQTSPRVGRVLERSSLTQPRTHSGVEVFRVTEEAGDILRATTWLNDGRWMLVVQQKRAEVMAPVRRALLIGVAVLSAAVMLVAGTTVVATSDLVGRIERGDAEREVMSRDLLRSAKLASLGEMATGLAHEINNPLAIISAEQTNIADLARELSPGEGGWDRILESTDRCRRQVERCGGITGKMLQFGRKTEVGLQSTDIGPRLQDAVQLMAGQAEVSDVELKLEIEPQLPQLLLDPTELEQVIANLVNNALYATRGGGRITVSARRGNHEVVIAVTDNGRGIAPEDLERIFQPFFTTKGPGEGTGLGLSVCYGIVQHWGGTIEAQSALGRGTTVSVHLPVPREASRA